MLKITSTEAQNNFGRYIKLAQFEDIVVTKNGKDMVVIKPYQEINKDDSIVAEKAGAYDWENEKISYEDFLRLSEGSEERYEYIDGEVYLLTSPSFDHQSIIMEISNTFYNWFKGEKCKPITSPFDVTLLKHDGRNSGKDSGRDSGRDSDRDSDRNVVQPDIIIICDPENINERRRYTGTPTLVVEVLSESTQRKDMLMKLNLYSCSGIREYWIINPFNKEVYVYDFDETDIKDYRTYKNKETVVSSIFEGLMIPLGQIFGL